MNRPHQLLQVQLQEERVPDKCMQNQPLFEIRSVVSNADVEYVGEAEKQVLHKYADITLRIYEGFDWEKVGDVAALCRRLQKAQQWMKVLNDE